MSTAPILLFVHGTNFCKEIWRPIERHLKASPVFQHIIHFVSIDLPYHGSKRDDSVPAVINEVTPSVKHPASKFVTLNTEAVHRVVQQLHERFGGRPIVGIGHSM
ncbi:hypothetical protein PC116_g14044 [Phytophthora cactorum]|uniref:AB hydrolase-1 domain-containing protein n=1 Tax=Phytophthora cactorum TaxID=29920 RepID=A0A329S7R0_9STRA|nr:hypothetical protein PC112_g11483 [Phytophthora cactorum]KAG2822601.1 hypothetical protein PC111_g10574 [Phytophthora cactorum]KAG2855943.1 hypothetical protein PC113_g11995 [Phytophthora cactorum]KAG2902695.1 hypothetical protein PC114_g12623 [Phytophthora cactorum]KAG2917008.1 hypothetical protein PC115_g10849 [Phytophthora cactorum]